jgi:DeoR family glycerol-3-phosphate regulon repressor
MIAHAGASYVLADSSKLGQVAVHRVCALAQVTAIVTNEDSSEAMAEAAGALGAAGCDVLRAPVSEATAGPAVASRQPD